LYYHEIASQIVNSEIFKNKNQTLEQAINNVNILIRREKATFYFKPVKVIDRLEIFNEHIITIYLY